MLHKHIIQLGKNEAEHLNALREKALINAVIVNTFLCYFPSFLFVEAVF